MGTLIFFGNPDSWCPGNYAMPSTIARYSFLFILIHWALVVMGVVLLGLGWYIKYVQLATPERSLLLDLHMSLGLTSAILISIQILLRIVFKPPTIPNYFPKWRKSLAYTLYLLIYVSFALMLISGYLQAVFSGTPLQFWGALLPVWGTADEMLAGFFGATHRIVAFVLAGSFFAHVCTGALNKFKHPGITIRALPVAAQESREPALGETQSLIASRIAQRLAQTLRLFGWIGFCLQLVFAFISALLLAFATTGRAFNAGTAW
jgi:cytochrome b561